MKVTRHNLFSFALTVGCLSCMNGRATEPSSEPRLPWQQTIREIKGAQTLVASRVVTQVTVRDGGNVFLGSIESVDTVAWKETRPVWVNVSKKTTGSPGFTMELNLHIEDNPGGILDGYDTWTDKGKTTLNGRRVVLWEGSVTGAAGNRALAYLDPWTARPWRVDLELPIHSNFGTRSVSVTVDFGPGPRDTWVPLGAAIEQTGRFMFWKRHLVITKSFQDWVERGSTALTTGGSTVPTPGLPP